MKILCAGGGSGGHVTPVVVVINEVLKQYPRAEVTFICDKAFESQARGLVKQNVDHPVSVLTIPAGKFRRYKHLTMLRQLFMPSIVLANLGDIFKVLAGFLRSVWVIWRRRPDVVFAKGGYVCLPVGMAARVMRVPIVVHDSDARPGLTNTILGRWASAIATGSPLENYRYKKSISKYVGVPISTEFRLYDDKEKARIKAALGFDKKRPLVVVTGGGLGAVSINNATLQAAPQLVGDAISIFHVTGKQHYDDVQAHAVHDERYQVVPFVYRDMAQLLGAADVVVSRASATFIQELAGVGTAAILVPAKQLGDQQKNAAVYEKAKAAVVLSDYEVLEPNRLYETISDLLKHNEKRLRLARNLHGFSRPNAARDVAQMIIDTVRSGSK